jgi:ABC-2 type transport system permease protein
LVITRDALRDVFASRFFLFCYFIALLPTAYLLVAVYAAHNLSFLQQIGITDDVVGNWMLQQFYAIFPWQTILAFLLALIIGPNLIIPDLNDNALPLYLCRPMSRRDYVLGKMAVMMMVLSPVTWMGSILAFIIQIAYEGGGWGQEHFRIGLGHLVGHLTWIIVISLLSLAIAAWVRYKFLARAILLAMLAMLSSFHGILFATIKTSWGALIDIAALIVMVVLHLFDPAADIPIPVWCAWTMLVVFSLLSLLMLTRKIKAHEVIR